MSSGIASFPSCVLHSLADPQEGGCGSRSQPAEQPRQEFLLIGGSEPVEIEDITLLTVRMDMFDGLFRFLTGADDDRQFGGQNDAASALALLLIEVARSDDR